METNIDIVLSTQSNTSGIEKYEKAIKGAEKATSEFEKVQKSQEQQSENSISSIGRLVTGLGTLSAEENKLVQALSKRNKEIGISITQSRESIKTVKEITSTISKDFITSQKDTKKAIQETTVAYNEFLTTISNQKSLPEITKSSLPSPTVLNKKSKGKSTASSSPKIESSSVIPESVVNDVGDKGKDTGDLFTQNFIDEIDKISPEISAIIQQLSDPDATANEQFLGVLDTVKKFIPYGEEAKAVMELILDPDATANEQFLGVLDTVKKFIPYGEEAKAVMESILDPDATAEEKFIGVLTSLQGLIPAGEEVVDIFEKIFDPDATVGEKLLGVTSSLFSMMGSLAGEFGKSVQQSLEPFDDQIDKINEKYDEMSENISEQKEAIEEQDQEKAESSEEREVEKAELKEEREVEAIEAELSRLSEKENVFLTAEEHKKQAELKKNLELIKSEQKKAKEKEKLDKIQADNEKKRKAEIAEVKFRQDTADWENQKSSFEANKKQTIFEASAAIAKAPVDAALAVVNSFTKDPTGILSIATAVGAGLAVIPVITSAGQLKEAANSTFNVPVPVKAMYTGGVVPLNEGTQFMIGGRMGAEEMATVKGDSLYIDNAIQTSQKEYSNSSSIIIQNMVIQTNDPEDFADSLVNQMREEQYV